MQSAGYVVTLQEDFMKLVAAEFAVTVMQKKVISRKRKMGFAMILENRGIWFLFFLFSDGFFLMFDWRGGFEFIAGLRYLFGIFLLQFELIFGKGKMH